MRGKAETREVGVGLRNGQSGKTPSEVRLREWSMDMGDFQPQMRKNSRVWTPRPFRKIHTKTSNWTPVRSFPTSFHLSPTHCLETGSSQGAQSRPYL